MLAEILAPNKSALCGTASLALICIQFCFLHKAFVKAFNGMSNFEIRLRLSLHVGLFLRKNFIRNTLLHTTTRLREEALVQFGFPSLSWSVCKLWSTCMLLKVLVKVRCWPNDL